LVGCYRASQEELQYSVNPINSGNYLKAIAQLQTLKEKYPRDSRIYYYLGFAYLKENDYRSALEYINIALKLSPNYKQVIGDVDLANFLAGNSSDIQQPFFKLALRELQKIINTYRHRETADEIRYHLGFLYLLKKEYRKALQALQNVIAEPPISRFDIQAQLAKGDIYLNFLNQPEKGITIYQEIINRYPGKEEAAEALYKLALYYKQRGDMYRQRHLALEEFYHQWEGIVEFAKDREEAKLQAKADLKKAYALQKTAISQLKDLIRQYPRSPYNSKAQELLADLAELYQ